MDFYENYITSIIRELDRSDKLMHEVVENNLPIDTLAIVNLLEGAGVWQDRVDSMYEGETLYKMLRDILFRTTIKDVYNKLKES